MNTAREAWELREQEMHDLMLPFVKTRPTASQMKWQFETVEKIVNGCLRLKKDGDCFVPEFMAGTDIGTACDTAWQIYCHTGMSVRFVFNGVEIRMTGNETKGKDKAVSA